MVRFRWCALLALIGLAALAARHAARPEQFFDPPASRRVAERVRALQRHAGDPAAVRLEASLERAESMTRAAALRPWWQGAVPDAAQAWHEVESAAAGTAGALRAARLADLERWPVVVRAAGDALARAQGLLSAPVAARWSRAAAVAAATVDMASARSLAAVGRLGEAIELAERSRRRSEAVQDGWLELHSRFDDPGQRRLWNSLVEAAFREAAEGRTHVVIDKLARRLDVYAGTRRLAAFDVELGSNGLAQKIYAGDRATPEGRYEVVERRGPGQTRYLWALLLDYPNATDRQRWDQARREGSVPAGAGPGGLIEIHARGGRGVDWTDGCVALADRDMERVFALVPKGATVTIVGTYERESERRSANG